mgnify:FL=1
MLDQATKHKIDTARQILVGKVPDPKAQVEQITTALIYKFMDDMDKESIELGGEARFFTNGFSQYSWTNLLDNKLSGQGRLDLYVQAITNISKNPNIPQLFRDIFKGAFLPFRDPRTLTLFLKEINEFTYEHSENLGNAFEYLLSIMGSQGDAGQFRTPRHIIDFIVEAVNPKKNETILDPACGTAGFLISAYKHIKKQHDGKDNITGKPTSEEKRLTPDEKIKMMNNFVGYDISPDMVKLSLVNLYLHGFPEPKIQEYDALSSEEKWDETYDVVLANPPFMTPKGGIRPHKRFSIRANRAEVLFVDYIAEHLNINGRAGIIVPEGIIFQSSNAYKQLRKNLVENWGLYAVVSLPAGVFQPYSGVKTSILLLDRALAKKTNHILFAKISSDGYGLGAQRRAVVNNDLPLVLDALSKYKKHVDSNGTFSKTGWPEGEFNIDTHPNIHFVSKKKIFESGDHNLTGERYREMEDHSNLKWDIVSLGEVCKTTSGGTPLKSRDEYYDNGDIPWLRSGEVAQGKVKESKHFITKLGLEKSSAKIFPKNTVLVAMYGATAGQVGILQFEAATNQAICGILPNRNLVPEFLFRILKSKKDEMARLAGGGAQPNISQTIIRKLKIPLPPFEIQMQIVAELDSYQIIIDGAKQVVENWKPNIKINPEWKIVELKEICSNFQYGSSKKSLLKGEIPCLRMGNIQNGEIVWDNIKYAPLDEELDKYLLNKNDVLFNRTNSPDLVGKTAIYRGGRKAVFAGYLIRVNYQNEKIIGEYLNYLMNSALAKEFCQKVKTDGVSQSNINARLLSTFKIPLPTIEIQNQIVTKIEAEKRIVDANKELIKIYQQKIKDKTDEVWGRK